MANTAQSKRLFVPKYPAPITGMDGQPTWRQQMDIALRASRNPLESFDNAIFEKPVVQFRLFGDFQTTISDPKMIKHCLIDNVENYKMHPLRQHLFRPLTGDGLLTAEGDTWLHARQALSPLFTPRNVTQYAKMMVDVATKQIPRFLETPSDQGNVISLSEVLSHVTYSVLSETLFSGEISRGADAITKLIAFALLELGQPALLDFLGVPESVPRLGKLTGMRAMKRLRKLINNTTIDRRQRVSDGQEVPQDFLTLLLRSQTNGRPTFTNAQIEDQLVTFIGAGHETTAQSINWLFYLLSQDSAARKRVEDEVDALDIETLPPDHWHTYLPWTMACFNEALRLFPTAIFLFRKAIEPDEFEGVIIPAGGALIVNIWALHRHRKIWLNPDAFDPTRFLQIEGSKVDRFHYLPFGIGRRVCIGARFAMIEASILIPIFMRRYRFAYASDTPPMPTLRLSLQADNGMPMRVSKRHA